MAWSSLLSWPTRGFHGPCVDSASSIHGLVHTDLFAGFLPHPYAAAFEHVRALSTAGSSSSLMDAGPSAFAAAAAAGGGGGGGAAGPPPALPPSGFYAASCRAFTWPLLAPQSQASAESRQHLLASPALPD
jgi:hypothetical protein